MKEKYEIHIKNKNEARKLKIEAKELAMKDESILVAGFDLQKVLPVPFREYSDFFNRHKLSVYDLTITNLISHDTCCYVWDQTTTKRLPHVWKNSLKDCPKMWKNFIFLQTTVLITIRIVVYFQFYLLKQKRKHWNTFNILGKRTCTKCKQHLPLSYWNKGVSNHHPELHLSRKRQEPIHSMLLLWQGKIFST